MKKTPSFKALLAAPSLSAVRSETLTRDVNEILDTVAKEDKLVALSRQRVDGVLNSDDRNAEALLQMLKRSLNTVT
jgi:hypothetical protein